MSSMHDLGIDLAARESENNVGDKEKGTYMPTFSKSDG